MGRRFFWARQWEFYLALLASHSCAFSKLSSTFTGLPVQKFYAYNISKLVNFGTCELLKFLATVQECDATKASCIFNCPVKKNHAVLLFKQRHFCKLRTS